MFRMYSKLAVRVPIKPDIANKSKICHKPFKDTHRDKAP